MATLPVANNAEGGTSGVNVTAVNSGGASGDAFDNFADASSLLTYQSAAALHGSLGYRTVQPATSVVSYGGWTGLGVASGTPVFLRVYLRPSTLVPTILFTRWYDSGGVQATELNLAGGKLVADNASGGAIAALTSTTTFVANQAYRIEWMFTPSTTAGAMEFRIFTGANIEGTTADEAKSVTAQSGVFGGSANLIRFGNASSVSGGSWTLDFDDLTISTAGWIGPVSTVSTQTVRPDADVATTGWSTAPLFSKVNDQSDATVITGPAARSCERRWHRRRSGIVVPDREIKVPVTA